MKSFPHREPLGVPHRGIALTHPSNPVIFLDIKRPDSEMGGVCDALPYRFMFELFADLTPTIAANMYALCVGSTSRVVEHRLQPAGYKETVLHDVVIGQYVLGGDVMGGGGDGFFSALGERQGPLQIPVEEFNAIAVAAPIRCTHAAGIYMQIWNYNSQQEVGSMRVASTFRIDTVERDAVTEMPPDAILVGRMVHRNEETRVESARMLLTLSKDIFHAKRNAKSGLFPRVELCGEM